MTKAEKIKKELELLSPEFLNKVDDFISSLLSRQKKKSLEEKKNIIESLCGSWADDKSSENLQAKLIALIAATAITHKKATLVTNNLRHFENIEGREIENWSNVRPLL